MRIALVRSVSVSGIVVLKDGSPAKGAEILLADRRGNGSRALSDDLGRFEIEGGDPESRLLQATLGDDLVASTGISLPEGGSAADVRLMLRPRERSFVRVRIVDPGGRGVPGARISNRWREEADDDGEMTLGFSEPPGTTESLTARAHGFLDTTVEAETSALPDAAPVVEIAMNEGVALRLDVRTQGGLPIDDADVSFSGNEWCVTDGDDFHLDPGATYGVRISARGFLAHEIPAYRPPPGGGTIAATLRPAAVVRGRAVDAAGEPMRRVFVEIAGGIALGDDTIDCAPDGTFVLEDVGEGQGTLGVGPAYASPEAAVEIVTVSGRTTDVGTLTLLPRVALTGRVLGAGGRPLGGATVEIDTEFSGCLGQAFTHADGTFRIDAAGFAKGHVVARKAGFGTMRVPFDVGPARPLGDILLPEPGAVEFGAEASDVALLWPSGGVVEYGERRIGDVAPGRYLARFMSGGTARAQEIEVLAGETTRVASRLER